MLHPVTYFFVVVGVFSTIKKMAQLFPLEV